MEPGFSLIEVLIALLLFSFISYTVGTLCIRAKHLEQLAKEQEQRLLLLIQQTENLELSRY